MLLTVLIGLKYCQVGQWSSSVYSWCSNPCRVICVFLQTCMPWNDYQWSHLHRLPGHQFTFNVLDSNIARGIILMGKTSLYIGENDCVASDDPILVMEVRRLPLNFNWCWGEDSDLDCIWSSWWLWRGQKQYKIMAHALSILLWTEISYTKCLVRNYNLPTNALYIIP